MKHIYTFLEVITVVSFSAIYMAMAVILQLGIELLALVCTILILIYFTTYYVRER